jgi:hypothetical protein
MIVKQSSNVTKNLQLMYQGLWLMIKVIGWCLWHLLMGWAMVNMLFFKPKKWDIVTKLFLLLAGRKFYMHLTKPKVKCNLS